MGRRKAKTRLVIGVDGVDRELFSVRERKSDGYLAIMLKPPRSLDLAPDDNVLRWKVSIHPSPASPGFTFKSHTQLASGSETTTAAFVLPRGRELVWPILAHRPHRPFHESFVSRPWFKDETQRLCSYNPLINNLFYFLIVSDANTDLTGHTGKLPLKIMKFQSFRLNVIYAFMPAPSIEKGHVEWMVTSTPGFNGEGGEPVIEDATSFPKEALPAFVANSAIRMRDRYCDYLADRVRREQPSDLPAFIPQLQAISSIFLREPIE